MRAAQFSQVAPVSPSRQMQLHAEPSAGAERLTATAPDVQLTETSVQASVQFGYPANPAAH
jgi:hypothetical protein